MSNISASSVVLSATSEYKMFSFSEIERACEIISNHVKAIRRGGRRSDEVYNDVIIGADTETSKTHKDQYITKGKSVEYVPHDNIVVAWTITLRARSKNICTIYGGRPSDFCTALSKIHACMHGDRTIVFFHFLSYDYTFLELFLFREFGHPVHQLNTKPHYPVSVEFDNGIILRDSLIIAQKTLERWATELDVSDKKAVGKWDYNKIRDQSGTFSADELEYIEHDTLALVECLDKLRENLHKHVYSIPLTCTAIIREAVRKEGRKNRAHNRFLRIAPDWDLYNKCVQSFHGGYTHNNRHTAGWIINNVVCYDIASSYPTRILIDKMPIGKFRKVPEAISYKTIMENMETNAFIFTFIATGLRLRDPNNPMPVLQLSKCLHHVNAITDNGRILEAEYVEIVLNDIDLQLIVEQYTCAQQACTDVYCATKGFLPRWFRDFVYNCFKEKCTKKGGDPVDYALAKAKLNSIYGCIVQQIIKEDIIEDYDNGGYVHRKYSDDPEEDYRKRLEHDREIFDKYMESFNSITPYFWGCYVTSYAMRSLHQLGACVADDGDWLYCDTDSVYSDKWDMKKLEAYNADIKTRMLAQGYDPVVVNDKEYWCGVAEKDGDYKEFIGLHSKCYAVRKQDDTIKITVAGVPKRGAECLHGDLKKFDYGFVFDGKTTGKLTHYYIYRNKIDVIDGIEYGNSVDLHECDYLIKRVTMADLLEIVEKRDVEMQVYDDV